jgi:regulation of enolase protein 1 (concanavalin A-like superfamily)
VDSSLSLIKHCSFGLSPSLLCSECLLPFNSGSPITCSWCRVERWRDSVKAEESLGLSTEYRRNSQAWHRRVVNPSWRSYTLVGAKMAPGRNCFDTLNLSPTTSLPQELEYFTLTAQPSSKIWREPGLPDTVSAPMMYTTLREPLILAEVTITATFEMEWDQAGLFIFVGSPPHMEGHQSDSHSHVPCRRWVKAGLQLSSGTLHVFSAAAISPSGADLSLTSLSKVNSCNVAHASVMPSVRIKFERLGDALWVFYQEPQPPLCMASHSPTEASAEWQKVREVAGFFWGIDRKDAAWSGCYASRPMRWNSSTSIQGQAEDESNGLWVEFEDLEIV